MNRGSLGRKVVTITAVLASLALMVAARAPRLESAPPVRSLHGRLDERAVRRHHVALVREAQRHYVFGPEKAAVAGDPAVIGLSGAEPVTQFTAAAAIRNGDGYSTPSRELAAKVYVDHDYPRLGLAKGNNYVFVISSPLSSGQPDRVQRRSIVVPENVDAAMHFLKGDPSKHLGRQAPDAIIARLAGGLTVLALCLDDCPTGHCGHTDTDGMPQGIPQFPGLPPQ